MIISKKQKGFSLVELGVSLTIIAMVVAAVVAGANLKDKFELNQAIKNVGNINSAVKEFKDIYNGYPGDMFDAEDKLGASETNNGDGDNIIAFDINGNGTLEDPTEAFLFWQHLAIAGLIEGSYDGVSETMKSPISKGIYTVTKNETESVIISLEKSGAEGLLSTKQAWEVDTKFDDGQPSTGAIRAVDGTSETAQDCVTDTDSDGADEDDTFNLGNNDEEPCVLQFYIENSQQ